MSNRWQNRNQGRCERCVLSYVKAFENDKNGVKRNIRVCYKYGSPCLRVTRNCTAPPCGHRGMSLTRETREDLSRVKREGRATPIQTNTGENIRRI